jgi:general secretion pathway protein D
MPQVGEPLPGPSAVGRQATIMADDNTNTLLISAAPEQIELARQLLDWLDVLPPQVHIQAIIAEITLTRDTSLGFQWESLGRIFGKFQGGTFTGDVSSNFGLLQKDDQGKVITPTGFFGQISGPEFHAVLSALTTDSHARILSTPSVFTSNNQPAQINVSSQRPFPRGTLTTTTGTTNLAVSTSIDYLSVGIVLTVTPRITQNNVVQMDVTIAADEPGAAVNIAGQEYPSVSARQLQTPSISVKDGYTIVLGGLMRDTITRTASRVPLLGDLPIVGSLFRSTSSKREKSELVVFLTPRVVRTESQAAAVTEAEKAKLLEVPRSLRGPSASAPQKGEPGS